MKYISGMAPKKTGNPAVRKAETSTEGDRPVTEIDQNGPAATAGVQKLTGEDDHE